MTEENDSLRKSRQQFLAEIKITLDLGGTWVWLRPLPFLSMMKENTDVLGNKTWQG